MCIARPEASGTQRRHGFDQAEPDHPPRRLRAAGRQGHAARTSRPARHGWSRRCRPASRRNRKSRAGSSARPVGSGSLRRYRSGLRCAGRRIVGSEVLGGLVLVEFARAANRRRTATSKPTERLGHRLELARAPSWRGSTAPPARTLPSICALSRSSSSISSLSLKAPCRPFDLDRLIVPRRHLVARHVPIGALIGVARRQR